MSTAAAAINSYILTIRSDGTLAAWGRNDFGQTNAPAGTFTPSAVPARVPVGGCLRANGVPNGCGNLHYGVRSWSDVREDVQRRGQRRPAVRGQQPHSQSLSGRNLRHSVVPRPVRAVCTVATSPGLRFQEMPEATESPSQAAEPRGFRCGNATLRHMLHTVCYWLVFKPVSRRLRNVANADRRVTSRAAHAREREGARMGPVCTTFSNPLSGHTTIRHGIHSPPSFLDPDRPSREYLE